MATAWSPVNSTNYLEIKLYTKFYKNTIQKSMHNPINNFK